MSDSPFDDEPGLNDDVVHEDTRVFIVNAGLHRRQSQGRRFALLAVGVLAVAGVVIVLDTTGVVQLVPKEEAEVVLAVEEPKPEPVEPAEPKPAPLRDTLLGEAPAPNVDEAPAQEPEPSGPLDARALFKDANKSPTTMNIDTREIRAAVVLPDGLTGEAIAKVVSDNGTATKLCITEGMRSATPPKGKVEFDVTIASSGIVSSVGTRTASARGSSFATCMEKRVASWRFPPFDGEPVVVVIPYVLSGGPL